MKTLSLTLLALLASAPALVAQNAKTAPAAPAPMGEMAADPARPQVGYASFIQLRGKVAGKDAYTNKDGTFAALRIVTWSKGPKDEKTKADTFVGHFTSIVAFGEQAEELAALKKGDRLLVQGQLEMIDPARRYKGDKGQVGDSHRVIARYVEKLAAKEPVKGAPAAAKPAAPAKKAPATASHK